MSFIPDVSLGENASIEIGDSLLLVQSGTVRENPQEIPTGCNLTGGYTTRTRGFSNLEIDVECQWTVDENPFSNPPTLIPGENTTDEVYVYPDFENEDTAFYSLPVAYCATVTCKMDCGGAGGVISYSLSLKNQGEYGTPSRSLS